MMRTDHATNHFVAVDYAEHALLVHYEVQRVYGAAAGAPPTTQREEKRKRFVFVTNSNQCGPFTLADLWGRR